MQSSKKTLFSRMYYRFGMIVRALIFVALLSTGNSSLKAQTNYVFYNGTYNYLYNDNGSLKSGGLRFDKSSVWTASGSLGTISSYTNNNQQLYTSNNNNGTVSLRASGSTWYQNTYLATRTGNWNATYYYLKATNATSFTTSNSNGGNRYTPYSVTIDDLRPGFSSFEITGGEERFNTTGSSTYGHTNATYINQAYTHYYFNGNNYYVDESNTSTTTAPGSVINTASAYTWSLSDNANGYATVNSSGVVTVSSIPTNGNLTITLICTVSQDNQTAISTKSITLSQTGVSGGTVTIDDREDHNWSYYQSSNNLPSGYPTEYLSSPNPRNVKITYRAGGVDGASAAAISALDGEGQNEMVYYKTLEKTVLGMSGDYPYTVISNPFSKRPKKGSTYYGFAGWKVISGGEYISEYADNAVLPLDQTIHFINLDNNYTPNCTSGEIVFEATWTAATVKTGYQNISFTGGTYETNFWVFERNQDIGNISIPANCTASARYPDGTVHFSNRLTGTISAGGNNAKIEFVNLNSTSTVSAAGNNFTVGRGVVNSSNGGDLRGCVSDMSCIQTVKIESGTYATLHNFTNGISAKNSCDQLIILGCDYDRAKNDNSKLTIRGDMYIGTGIQLNRSANSLYTRTYIKSGNFGSTVTVKGNNSYTGAGGSNTYYYSVSNTHNAGRRYLCMEGGRIFGIAGGMDESNNQSTDARAFDLRVRGTAQIDGVVYGAAEYANAKGIRTMVFTGGTINGWIAGGANGTQSTNGALQGSSYLYFGGTATTTSEGTDQVMNRAVGGNIFGAGCGNSATSSSGQVTLGTNVVVADQAYVERGVYGGGSYGYTTSTANLFILGGTIDGKVGGVSETSYSANIIGGVYGGACQNQGGTVNITMTGGEVHSGVYGGSNANGAVTGPVTMNINGGQVGINDNNTANIHGGGYGSSTSVTGNVTLTIGECNAQDGVTVYGDVYGGSALGSVNSSTSNLTKVTLNAGTIYGALYGGALGDNITAAPVNGQVEVVVTGGSVLTTTNDPKGEAGSGSVFGGNNVNGTPKSTVKVDIYRTNAAPAEGRYALHAVYGGGNQSDYDGTPAVTIHGGATNSIEYVYGGGNAADVKGTNIVIYGGNKIGNVFGGGNGFSETGNHSNPNAAHYNPGAEVTANGTSVKIYGGTIGSVYGGSNQYGTITGGLNVEVESNAESGKGPCDIALANRPIHVGALYGGGNQAPSAIGTISVKCMDDGAIIDTLFCGANRADVTGSVNFEMTGGRIGNLFGGNNNSGIVSGSITLTVNWTTACNDGQSHYLGNVFGGGNLATFGTAQNAKAPTVKILNGTVSGNVYGGGKGNLVDGDDRGVAGKVTGNPTVIIGDIVNGHTAIVEGDVYGGGDAADVAGVPEVTVNDCNSQVGNVYGGGNAADINGATVTINGGTIGDVFGGGHGDKRASNPSKYADVNGNVTLTVYGGTISRVFAGSNSKGKITGTSSLTVDKSGTCDMIIGEVYGGGNEAAGNASSISIGCTGALVTGDNGHAAHPENIGTTLEGIGYVYGGANQADIGTAQSPSNIKVDINSGIVANVFGGNNTSGTINGTITVNIEKTSENNNCGWYVGNVFGGGNLAQYSGSPAVNIKNGTVSGNVYGGGKGNPGATGDQVGVPGSVTGNPVVTIGDNADNHSAYSAIVLGDVYGGGDAAKVNGYTTVAYNDATENGNNIVSSVKNIFGGGNAAGVSGTTTVTLTSGTVTTGLYGGCNATGTVSGAISVYVNGGTVGASGTHAYGIFGGGKGSATATGDAVTVTIGNDANISPTIYGDVYGGSAEGNVNDALGEITKVWLKKGTINGDVYGGGFGDNGANALVNGAVQVVVDGGTVTGKVFGCNNANGTPKGAVTVTINGTDQPQSGYALGEVYGGGNMADYSPTAVNESYPAATVVVYGCDNSIEFVYGGGNAADVPATSVTIYGGTIGTVFGGGHGDKDATPTPTEANVSGDVTVNIYGGTITQVFGGSNSKGTISGEVSVNVAKSTEVGACPLKIGEVYGGGNLAAGNAGSVTIGCTGNIVTGENGHAAHPENIGTTLEGIGKVFGGANNANIGTSSDHSDITLNINSGMVANVFGGNNNGGTIYGDITVNIEQTSDGCGWYVGNVYGAGNLAAYTGTPTVNVKNGEVSLNVYGGGKGASAVVTGNPYVTIGDISQEHSSYVAEVKGSVFGGGDAAAVTGNATVLIQKANTKVDKVFGGGNDIDDDLGISGTATVNITNGSIASGVYGGCNANGSVGPVAMSLTGGQVGDTGEGNSADVYGGGYGSATKTTGDIDIALNGTTIYGDLYGGSALGGVNASTSNTTTVTVSTATLHGSVFGGGKGDNNTTATSEGNAIVNIEVYDQYLTGIYGGANVRGLVKGNINVNIKANVGASGDGNSLDIFGGGYGAATNTNGSVTVTIGDEAGTYQPEIYGDIYGGSALGNVNDAAADITTVNFLNGTLHGNLYGGGLGQKNGVNGATSDIAALVKGQVVVNISSSTQTVGNCHIDLRGVTIYGCNNTNGSPQDNVTVNIYKTAHLETNGGYAIDQVFGGGNQADYLPENGLASSTKKTTVHIYGCDNTIRRVFAGGNAAAATGVASIINGGRFDDVFGGGNGEVTAANIGAGGTNLQVHGGSINRLFGGSNASGTITGQMGVSIDSEGGCDDEMFITEFFCGNNKANIGTVDGEPVTINATIGCGTKFGSVYGGCNLATIYGSVNLTIEGGEMEYVYGGSKGVLTSDNDPDYPNGMAADITGNVHLIIKGGDIDNVFGGSNKNGNIRGSITVDIVKDPNPCKWDIGNVYGASNLAAYSPTNSTGNYPEVNIKNGTINGNVYGGGKGASAIVTSYPKVTIGDNSNANYVAIVAARENVDETGYVFGGGDAAKVIGNTTVIYNDANLSSSIIKLFGGGNAADIEGTTSVTLTAGKVTGGVYGGCNSTGSVGAVTVTLNGGTIGAQNSRADVFGGGFGSPTTTTAGIEVELNGTTVYGDIYGGSALGKVNASTSNTTIVTINGSNGSANLHGSVFGGGMGNGNTQAVSYGNATVNINAPSAYTGIYGGANVNGLVSGDIELNINANVGASGNGNSLDVYGGGYGAQTETGGNVTVNYGNGSNSPVIYGAIYGGSALGQVNDTEGNDVTTVNIKSGTINGNIYGGGLGEAGAGNVTKGQVNGTVIVNIGSGTVNEQTGFATTTSGSATINGSVYGCNNTNGSPKANVTVNIYQTAHTTTNAASYTENDGTNGNPTYAIANVFGGGRNANYSPTSADSRATVHVYTCNNTIEDLFGGGDAAAAVGVVTIVDGGRFDRVFGGGNGEVTAADIGTGGTNLQIHGGKINTLFGGSNTSGTISGDMRVNIDAQGPCGSDMDIAEFFCGNNLADIGTAQNPVTINATIGCDTKFGSVYGGCNLAKIYGSVNLTIEGGEMEYVFGGSKGSNSQAADITGNVHLIIKGGDIDNVFGGSNINGNIGGSITVDIDKANPDPCDWEIGNVYGASNLAAYTPTNDGAGNKYPEVNIKNGTVGGDVFGGGYGASALATSSPQVNLIGGTVSGRIFGGGAQAPVTGSPVVTASYGSVTNIYGGGLGNTAVVTGSPSVVINQTSGKTLAVADVFGGGDAAAVTGNTAVTLTAGSVTRAFGGGNQAAISGSTTVNANGATVANIYGGGNEAGATTTNVNVSAGTVTTGVYGGSNSEGTITGAIAVSVTGGTIGSNATPANVHGGGYGHLTESEGNVSVTINGAGVNIYGDVYGGSALGNVNDATSDVTTVTLTNGTIHGSIYGGGLGDASHAALVNGAVNVIVNGGTVTDKVFGANNVNGTPKGAVTVTINGTDQPQSGYALAEVYGGGNMATYSPTVTTTPATVVVNGCNNSIGFVYGGGNAADVPATDVTIWGGTIGTVFGGGHGDKDAQTPTEANVTGNVAVKIYGGTINEVFGGSNSKGAIGGTSTVTIEDNGGSCTFDVNDVYGGGNQADGKAGTLNIGCGAVITGNIYGGAKQANVNDDIHLVISGGNLHNVFGGNNISGNVKGSIIVDIQKDNACNTWKVDNVYGGGNLAAYSVYGYNNDGTPVTEGNAVYNDPVVNIKNGTVSVNVFGGGYGSSATVYGNPHVNLIGGAVTGKVFGGGEAAPVTGSPVVAANYGSAASVFGGGLGNTAVVTGNPSVTINQTQNQTLTVTDVFGGGDAAAVNGNTTVTLTAGSVSRAFGGGNEATINGNTTVTAQGATIANIYGGGNKAGATQTSVTVSGGSVTTGVYGGSNSEGTITGAIAVSITGGTIGTDATHTANVHGGGYGSATASNGNVSVTINGNNVNIWGDVYGGSALGNVNGSSSTTTVTLEHGTIHGSLYGGGLGDASHAALVNGAVNVVVNGGTVTDKVFGANNVNGTPKGAVTVTINGTDQPQSGYALAEVYGGGNQATYSPTVTTTPATVVVNGCDNSIGVVYGGGNAADVPATDVTIWGGTIGTVFGGGHGNAPSVAANVTGNVAVKIYGGTITEVFGGSNSMGNITGSSTVTIQEHQNSTCNMSITDVYGGGNQAAGNAGTLNIGCGALITGNVYGGAKEANVNNDIHLVITGGTLNNVFGGNNVSGTIAGTITVDINQDDNCDSWHVNNVYGGGNLAAYSAPAATKDYPVVNVMNGTISGNVFGGGLGSSAVVTANPHVNVTGGTIAGSLFGGGDEASVTGNTFISINGANAVINTKVFGGGNEAGISGNTTVTLTSGSVGNTANSGIYGGCNTSGTIGGNTYVYVVGGQVGTTTNSANVHGGGYGQNTAVSGDVTVNIGSVSGSGNSAVYSGTAMIYGSVYGGSALGTVNTDHHNGGTYNKTTVNLYGGTIDGNVYGGGLGSSSVAALVYGDVDVYQYGVGLVARYDEDDLPSSGMIFGCNNINGTPKGKVKVVVNKTVGLTGQQRSTAQQRATTTESDHHYELSAVYGGGNRAEYVPDDANGTTLVIIDGCSDISIHSVYGGGNAASTPATDVRVSGAYEIEYVFGGGNGAGKIDGNPNPGANVGYHAYPESMAGADQVEERLASQYKYGTGVAKTEIYGGRIHKVFGGSNTRGNVREATVAMLDEVSDCPLELDGIYGGGKSAYMEGNAEIELGCVSGLDEIYGGAEQADVGSAIVLTLTSGHYNKVYGGNNLGGKILGSITVNIEQTGCLPIEIGELYLGGNNAPYSVYGYNDDNTIKESGTRIYNEPVMNLRSFKSIGTVYGGGEGAGAVLAGNPTINVNVATGWVDGQYKGTGDQDPKHIYHAAPQDLTPDGTIGAIFGGGNAAKVIGNTNINIGDQSTVEMHSLTVLKQKIEESENDKLTMGGIVFELTQDGKSITYTVQGQNSPAITKPIIQNVNGATISGNVYGGGNQAAVTGETNVQVGPR